MRIRRGYCQSPEGKQALDLMRIMTGSFGTEVLQLSGWVNATFEGALYQLLARLATELQHEAVGVTVSQQSHQYLAVLWPVMVCMST